MAGSFGTTTGTSYVLTARDESQAAINSAITGVKKAQNATERMAAQNKKHLENMQKHWLAYSAGIAAAAIAVRKAWSLMDRAAIYEEQVRMLSIMGAQYDTTGQIITQRTKEAARGLLSLEQAADLAGNAMNRGLSPEQIYQFTSAAETLTDIIGGDVKAAFDKMTLAATTGRTQTLSQMGIIIDMQDVYDQYAVSIDKTSRTLSEQEKFQARVNAVLEAAKAKAAALGPTVDTNKDKMDRLILTLQDLELHLGTGLIRTGVGAIGMFYELASVASETHGVVLGINAMFAKLQALLPGPGKAAAQAAYEELLVLRDEAFAQADEMREKADTNFEAALAKSTELLAAQAAIRQQIRDDDAAAQEEADLGEMETINLKLARLASYYAVTRQMSQEAAAIEIENLEESLARHASYYELKQQIADEAEAREWERLNREKLMDLERYNSRLATALAEIRLEKNYTKQLKLINKEKERLDQETAQNRYQTAVMLGQAMLAFAGVNSQEIFLLMQAFAVVESIIAAHQAAALALANPPGPPATIPLAASVLAWGYANAAAIAAKAVATYAMSSSSGVSDLSHASSVVGTTASSYDTSYDTDDETETEAQRPLTVNFHIYGSVVDHDQLAREITPSLRKAWADGA